MRRDGNRGKSGNTVSREVLVGFQVRGDGGLDQAEVVKNDKIRGIFWKEKGDFLTDWIKGWQEAWVQGNSQVNGKQWWADSGTNWDESNYAEVGWGEEVVRGWSLILDILSLKPYLTSEYKCHDRNSGPHSESFSSYHGQN